MFSVDQEWDNSSKQDVLSSKLFGPDDEKKKIAQKKKKKNNRKSSDKKLTNKTDTELKDTIKKPSAQNQSVNASLRKRKLDKTKTENAPESVDNNRTNKQPNDDSNIKSKKKKKQANLLSDTQNLQKQQSKKDAPAEKSSKPEKKTEKKLMHNGGKEDLQKCTDGDKKLINSDKMSASTEPNLPKVKNKKNMMKNKGITSNNSDTNTTVEPPMTINKVDIVNNNGVELENKHSNKNESGISEDKLDHVDNRVSNKLSKFQEKLNRKLEGGHFRWINETLYTNESREAEKLFKEQPNLFDVYHKGFESQVKHWPENPVDLIIDYLKKKPSSLVVADFGCGNAKLSQSIPNKVHSFDLVAVNKHVTACDMKRVPLPHSTLDIAVFSLALMGTNVTEFILEANRVLKNDGILKIAEVKSRFKDVNEFIENISTLGFQLLEKDDSNRMFVMLDFRKSAYVKRSRKVVKIELKPCIYKKR